MAGGTTVQTATSEPWAEQKPHLLKGFAGAEELLKGGLPEYFQGATLAGFDPAQTAAQQATMGYAMGPRTARMQQGAEGALGRSLGGYTGFNPQQTADLMAGNVDLGHRSPFSSTANALTQRYGRRVNAGRNGQPAAKHTARYKTGDHGIPARWWLSWKLSTECRNFQGCCGRPNKTNGADVFRRIQGRSGHEDSSCWSWYTAATVRTTAVSNYNGSADEDV